ncbi:hypothetical protein JXB37_03825 [candidate division WOR-3 bacterium]|nr:hypothetical protein [candidate division WOR-3 bacterium]
MIEKCAECGRAKAGRECPLLGAVICPRCCGEMRAAGRECPAECEHRQASVRRARERLVEATVRDVPGFEPVLHNLRLALVRSMQGAAQSEWLAAVAEARDRLRAGQSGLLYEHHHPDPRVEAGARELWSVVAGHLEGRDGLARTAHEDMDRALRLVGGQLESGEKRALDVARLFGLCVEPGYARAGRDDEEDDWRLVRTPR